MDGVTATSLLTTFSLQLRGTSNATSQHLTVESKFELFELRHRRPRCLDDQGDEVPAQHSGRSVHRLLVYPYRIIDSQVANYVLLGFSSIALVISVAYARAPFPAPRPSPPPTRPQTCQPKVHRRTHHITDSPRRLTHPSSPKTLHRHDHLPLFPSLFPALHLSQSVRSPSCSCHWPRN